MYITKIYLDTDFEVSVTNVVAEIDIKRTKGRHLNTDVCENTTSSLIVVGNNYKNIIDQSSNACACF